MVDLVINFDTLHQLYRAYMPFIKWLVYLSLPVKVIF